ncbi:MAG: glycoside hydrolase family 3 protein [Candidatus Aminicenantaceae bacterium]
MKKRLAEALALILVLAALSTCAQEQAKTDLSFDPSAAHWVSRTLSQMSLEQKIGQMIGLRYTSRFMNQDSAVLEELRRWVVGHHIGGFIQVRGGVFETAVLTNTLQQMADLPLLIASDLERGAGNQIEGATLFPPAMSIGATGSEDLAYAMGRITAIEARAVGIHMTYAPVVDVNSNPDNPIINVRSFGEDPEDVSRLAAAFIRGCQENGLIATAKHFPGHGDTDLDSHSVLPAITGDRERLDRVELVPFRASIEAGVRAIMSAHLRLPALDSTPDLPATLSFPIMTDLLRGELGFLGLSVTDALEMRGITGLYTPPQAAVKAVQAGVDMLLIPPETEEVIRGLIRAVEDGRLRMSRVDSAVKRILEVKARLGLHRRRTVDLRQLDTLVGARSHLEQARRAFEDSITLVKNEKGILPLAAGAKIALYALSSDPGEYYAGRTFAMEVQERSGSLSVFYADAFTGEEYFQRAIRTSRAADIRVVALFSRLADSKGSVGLKQRHIRLIKDLSRDPQPLVVISFNSPYFLRWFPEADTYFCAYRHADQNQVAAAKALFGEIEFKGRLPISIPGLFPAGHGVRPAGSRPKE